MSAESRGTHNSVLDRALELFDVDDYNAVMELLDTKDLQDDHDAIYIRGCAFELAGNPDKALELFLRLVDLGDSRGLGAVAQLYWQTDELDQALTWYQRASDAGDVDAELEFSRALLWLDRTLEAKAHLESLAASSSELGDEAAGLLGSVMALEGVESDGVRTLLRRGQNAEPDAKAWLGAFNLREGRDREGVRLLESALASGSIQASVALGNHYAEVGNFSDARRAYTVGVEAGDNFAMFNLGAMFYVEFPNERARALRLIRAAAEAGDALAKKWLRGGRK